MSGYSSSGMLLVQSGQVQVQMAGLDVNITTIAWRLYGGRIVSLLFQDASVFTSVSTELEVPPGTLPLIIRPDNNARFIACPMMDNSQRKMGRADVPSQGAGLEGGLIFLAPDATGAMGEANFTASGLKGVPAGTEIMYSL